MKKVFLLNFTFLSLALFSQGIVEYDNEIFSNFNVYDSSDCRYYKIDETEINLSASVRVLTNRKFENPLLEHSKYTNGACTL